MKIIFRKLETDSNNISVSFDNKKTFQNYDKNTVQTDGISIPDECTDFSNIVVKTYKSEISDLVYEIPVELFSQDELSKKLDKRIRKLKIPEGVTEISMGALANCTSLTSIVIPDGITTIDDWALAGCYGLTNISLPNSVKSIGMHAFNSCVKLTNIIIPDSITSISKYAFYICVKLTNIVIPETVTSIGDGAFNDCRSLMNINYKGTEDQWNAISKGKNWNKDCPADMVINYNYTK